MLASLLVGGYISLYANHASNKAVILRIIAYIIYNQHVLDIEILPKRGQGDPVLA